MKKLSKTTELKGSKLKDLMSSKRSVWFTIIVVISVIGTLMAGLLTSFLSGPIGNIGNPPTRIPVLSDWLSASAGLISFALIYVASDIISEVYGYKASRLVAFINMGASVLLTVIMGLAWVFTKFIIAYPMVEGDIPTLTNVVNDFFGIGGGNVILGGPILLIWGWIVAISGDWLNDIVFKIFKKKDGQNHFFKRSFLSSVAGQLLDGILFIPVLCLVVRALHGDFMGDGSFIASIYFKNVLVMFYCQVAFKLTVELLCFPLTRVLKKKMLIIEGHEAYEEGKGYGLIG